MLNHTDLRAFARIADLGSILGAAGWLGLEEAVGACLWSAR